MPYSLNTLTTVADCNALITLANKDKKSYENRIYNLNFDLEISQDNASARAARLLIVNSEIAMLDTVIENMPEGQVKEDYITTRLRKIASQRSLSSPGSSSNPVNRIDDELEIARLNLQLNETLSFIAAVEAHKATL
jgi:hypothetical protein